MIDGLENTVRIKPLCAAIVAGIVRREKSYKNFCDEFGYIPDSTYYKYTEINHKGKSEHYDGADFDILVDEFKKMLD